jgi:outer membrane protein OmpA-like peptidoglycan-associated protein
VRTQQLAALQTMKAKPTERGQVITFGDVLFDTGKSALKSDSQRAFQQLADFLSSNPERKVRVEGFTDSVGSETSNLALSQRRADAVAVKLQGLGVGADRVTSQGYGKQQQCSISADEQKGRGYRVQWGVDSRVSLISSY